MELEKDSKRCKGMNSIMEGKMILAGENSVKKKLAISMIVGALCGGIAYFAGSKKRKKSDVSNNKQSLCERRIKRAFDFCVSLVALIILFPVFVLIAIWIKATSTGPVFFLQSRLGKDGKEFKIIKFRTMVVNAEHIGTGLKVNDDSDDRITKAGHFLRKTSLDELPQLINVLIGDMSLVGPRPPVTYYPYQGYEGYSAAAKKRFEMRPGITGLAQVRVRNSATWDERIRYDVQYVKHFSIILDLWILFSTVFQVLKSENIYADKKEEVGENAAGKEN